MAPHCTDQPRVTLVLGGARSGKSRLAQALAETRWPRPCYLATAEIRDDEMRERIALHRRKRGPQWRCVEAPLEIVPVLQAPPGDTDGLLLDCATLWLSNVLLGEGTNAVARRRNELLDALRTAPLPTIIVSNEVGMGVVPDTPLGREFRDLQGWLNQDLAAAADAVAVVIAGLPLVLKGNPAWFRPA